MPTAGRPPSSEPPKYRKRIVRGRAFACLSLRCHRTGKRREFWLGPYGSPESHERYAQLVAEWKRGVESAPKRQSAPATGLTVVELCAEFLPAVQSRYGSSELSRFKAAIRSVCLHHASTPCHRFGPNALRTLREAMIAGVHGGKRQGWTRWTVSGTVRRIVAIFKWGVSHELISVETWQALKTIEPLRRGRCAAPEGRPVRPVAAETVNATLAKLGRHVAAMIRLQQCTGMRPGEVCRMRPSEIQRSGERWEYRPERHKGYFAGRERVIPLGPRARAIIEPFLAGRSPDAPLFSPREAEAERLAIKHAARRTPEGQGNEPGTNRAEHPQRPPGEEYDVASYRRAIRRACALAGVAPWHPHQLRHSFATELRREFGLEAARILLGHSSALVTEAIYAQRDEEAKRRIAEAVG